jgi:hypothetical protein
MMQGQLYGVPHRILRVFNTILYENEFQNPQIFQQTISLFSKHSTLVLRCFLKEIGPELKIVVSLNEWNFVPSFFFLKAQCVINILLLTYYSKAIITIFFFNSISGGQDIFFCQSQAQDEIEMCYCRISEKYTIWGHKIARNYVLSAHYIALIRAI